MDDIPPSGLRRIVPAESSSPESQGNVAQSGLSAGTFQSIDAVPLEPRVVMGWSKIKWMVWDLLEHHQVCSSHIIGLE
jgi:hypothetical protein